MITKSLPLSVTSLRIAAVESKRHNDCNGTGLDIMFNGRTDIILSTTLTHIAVEIGFLNERLFVFDSSHGIRRRISVALVNRTLNRVESKTTFTAVISRHTLSRTYRADIPVDPNSIADVCEFEILVRDENSRSIIGRKEVRFYDLSLLDIPPTKLYSVKTACLHNGGSAVVQAMLSCQTDDYSYMIVRFVVSRLISYRYDSLPELEISFRFADGSSHTCFSRPLADDSDDLSLTVDARILTTPQNRGICYAELRCFSMPIAGVVFSTSGPNAMGEWSASDDELNHLVEYSPDFAARRFQMLIDNHSDDIIGGSECSGSESDNVEIDAEDFDRLLDRFIASQDESDSRPDDDQPDNDSASAEEEQPENPSDFLAGLTGLDSVKTKLTTYSKIVRFMSMRTKSGLPVPHAPLHSMFLGSPGTGKTTVAKAMGRMLADAGILSKGHVVVRERSTLLGPNYSSESENTLKALEEARGGILLIDEAYQLYQPNDPRDPGRFVIDTLLTALADENDRDWMLILAGYPAPMMKMFEINPGLKSRIPDSNIYTFDDFTESQLMEIATRYLTDNGFSLSDSAAEALSARLGADYASRDVSFGNARHVINLIQTDILPAMAVRLDGCEKPDARMLSVIEPADIPAALSLQNPPRRKVGFNV